MKKPIFILTLILLISAIGYLFLYPVPIDPEAWTPQTNVGLTDIYQTNDKLSPIQKMADGQCPDCEDVAVDSNGIVYGGAIDGRIIEFSADFKKSRTIANTGGRPLGMITDNNGTIYVADGVKGLLSVSKNGQVKLLTDSFENRKICFPDDLALASDSSILFTEASKKFQLSQYGLDILEHRPNGNLFRYNLRTGITELLLDSLYFANGVAVSNDGSYALVNNLAKYEVIKYYLKGEQKGKTEVFVRNLPGFPDGVNISADGTVWVSIVSPRNAKLDETLPNPFLRKLFFRLPASATPENRFTCILGFNASGKLIHNLQDSKSKFSSITNCVPFHGKLYLGTIAEKGIGVYDLNR